MVIIKAGVNLKDFLNFSVTDSDVQKQDDNDHQDDEGRDSHKSE